MAPGDEPGSSALATDRRSGTLLEMRDELNVVRDLLIVLWLANASPMHAGNGSALCTLANLAREKLEAIGDVLDEHIAPVPDT